MSVSVLRRTIGGHRAINAPPAGLCRRGQRKVVHP
jgi:hypothetical protein